MVSNQDRLDRIRQAQEPARPGDRQPRRPVELKGYAVLGDGTSFGISVRDLSYDGCKVETAVALLPGVELKVSILGIAGAMDAVVRWCKDGRAGLRFHADHADDAAQKPRAHQRIELAGEVQLRRAGRDHYQARVFDLTQTGCKVEFVERPKAGELLWVKFPGLDSLEATVRWVDGFYGGLEFVRPIYPGVFDLLLARLTR